MVNIEKENIKMIFNALFLGNKTSGFNIFNAIYNTEPSTSWSVLCRLDTDDALSGYYKFKDFAKSKNIKYLTAHSTQTFENM